MKVTKTNLRSDVMYVSTNYPESGIYMNNDGEGNRDYVFVNRVVGAVYWLGSKDQIQEFLEPKMEKQDAQHGVLTEDFALKMLATALGKEKIKDIL